MLITNNEEALRVACADVLPDEIASLREVLEQQLARCARLGSPGVGLAAPQIGIAKKFAIVRLGRPGAESNFDLINAKIAHAYDPQMFRDEGCLSFPGRVETTTRFQEVHVVDNFGNPGGFIATGFTAVVVQHELDHLNQSLFFDKAVPKPKPKVNGIKLGPNEKCLCGSGVKFKKCCGRK